MEDTLKYLIYTLRQKHDAVHMLMKTESNHSMFQYYNGRKSAFAESAQLLSDILNSENPNSVSNQLDTEKH
jgi:hypothetical protein